VIGVCTRCGAYLRRGRQVKLCDPCFRSVVRGSDRVRSLIPEHPDWHQDANCRLEDADIFTSEVYSRDRRRPMASHAVRKAKHLCATCPVRRECLIDCLQHEERTETQQPGIWGGTTAAERRGYETSQVEELLTKMTVQAKKHGLMKKEKAA
jgi:WhiB family redox-sensing transcriptional regulator